MHRPSGASRGGRFPRAAMSLRSSASSNLESLYVNPVGEHHSPVFPMLNNTTAMLLSQWQTGASKLTTQRRGGGGKTTRVPAGPLGGFGEAAAPEDGVAEHRCAERTSRFADEQCASASSRSRSGRCVAAENDRPNVCVYGVYGTDRPLGNDRRGGAEMPAAEWEHPPEASLEAMCYADGSRASRRVRDGGNSSAFFDIEAWSPSCPSQAFTPLPEMMPLASPRDRRTRLSEAEPEQQLAMVDGCWAREEEASEGVGDAHESARCDEAASDVKNSHPNVVDVYAAPSAKNPLDGCRSEGTVRGAVRGGSSSPYESGVCCYRSVAEPVELKWRVDDGPSTDEESLAERILELLSTSALDSARWLADVRLVVTMEQIQRWVALDGEQAGELALARALDRLVAEKKCEVLRDVEDGDERVFYRASVFEQACGRERKETACRV